MANILIFLHYLGILWSTFLAFLLHEVLDIADFPAEGFAIMAAGH